MKLFWNLIAVSKAYEVVTDFLSCDRCISSGKQHCWQGNLDAQGGQGDWGYSYCCGPSDSICNSMNVCSWAVNTEQKKWFTCPVDNNKCPSGSDAELTLSSNQL